MISRIAMFGEKYLIVGAVTILASLSMALPAAADDYPDRPINMVVGFGVGGGADRTARAMSTYISEELQVPVTVVNRPGAGTQISANYVLSAPDDGYTIYSSTFSPYLISTILLNDAEYSLDDFSFVNLQNFDKDIIVANKDAGYERLADLIQAAQEGEEPIRGALVQSSSGQLMTKVLMDELEIPKDNINLVTYTSGGEARTAVAGGQVDFLIIAARGTESIAEFVTPLAIVSQEREPEWNVPTINEALDTLGAEVPVIEGAMRGIAVTKEFERQYPDRFEKLSEAVQNVLARKDVQDHLEQNDIGGVWVGPEVSTRMMQESYESFEEYTELLD